MKVGKAIAKLVRDGVLRTFRKQPYSVFSLISLLTIACVVSVSKNAIEGGLRIFALYVLFTALVFMMIAFVLELSLHFPGNR